MKRTLTEGQLQGRLRAALEWCQSRGIVYCDDSAARILAGRISKGLSNKIRKFVYNTVVDELIKHDNIRDAIVILEEELRIIIRR